MRSVFALIFSWLKNLYTTVLAKLGINAVPDTDDPDTPDPVIERPDPGEIVCYYGCPNSKKAKKLQLSKKVYR